MNLTWDPEFDTPATIAIVGGGVAGIEAALYARFLGYYVMLYSRRRAGDSLIGWGDAQLDVPSEQLTSSLGLAALEAQGTPFHRSEKSISYREFVQQYLIPLAKSDLLVDGLQINSPVQSISRIGCSPGTAIDIESRAEQEFRLFASATSSRGDFSQQCDIVLDCSGERLQVPGLAVGGGVAIGEAQCRRAMRYGKLDVVKSHPERHTGKHTVLLGSNLNACGNALDFTSLIAKNPATKLTWVVPKSLGQSDSGSNSIQQTAMALRNGDSPGVVPLDAWGVESLSHADDGWKLKLQISAEETLDLQCDELIDCLAGGGNEFDRVLQADTVPTSGLPCELRGVVTTEPHFYRLGQRATSPVTFQECREQIRAVFQLIGGRQDLDLYATVHPQG